MSEKCTAGVYGSFVIDGSGQRREIEAIRISIPGAEVERGSIIDSTLEFNLALVDFNITLIEATAATDGLARMFRQLEYRRYFRPLIYRLQPPRSRIVKVAGEWLKERP